MEGLQNQDGQKAWSAAIADRTERPLRAFKISPLLLLSTVLALSVGELASGTDLYFVAMMAVTLTCIGLTYNMLGGLSRISGFLFAAMAAATIVISQFSKVILFEAADRNLEVPHLTITVYAAFYLSAMMGVFLFAWIRLRLPTPIEPDTMSQSKTLYWIALIVGIIANTVFWIDTWGSAQSLTSTSHSISLAFSPLILFSIVLAVDQRIRETDGRHSLNARMIASSVAVAFYQAVLTSREGLASPLLVYGLACYVRGYRFKLRHYLALLAFIVLLQTVISPFEIYSRNLLSGQLSFRERVAKTYNILESPPSWQQIWNVQAETETYDTYDEYYSRPGTYILSRFSMIRADSHLIATCADGLRYGLNEVKADLLANIPRLLYRNKPDEDGAVLVEGIAGTSIKWAFTSVSDSYGAFGWMGVVLFPMLILPMIFIVYDSMFDMSRPWGTVALGIGVLGIWDKRMIDFIILLVKAPLSLWFLSLLTVAIARFMAGSGRRVESPGGETLSAYPDAQTLS